MFRFTPFSQRMKLVDIIDGFAVHKFQAMDFANAQPVLRIPNAPYPSRCRAASLASVTAT